MIQRRTVETGIETKTTSRRGAGEWGITEGESPGPDSFGQTLQRIEGYPTVGRQLAAGHRDHTAGPDAQQVIPASVERRFVPPRQDAQSCESRDDALSTEHLGAQELLGHLQEI